VPKAEELKIADNIISSAWDAKSKAKRIELAHKALEISADCADAYVMLAYEEVPNVKERIALLEEGVKAGRRALGARYFKEDVGSFWLILETRPYMRALCALADQLLQDGQSSAAVEHFFELLRLNPNDNQGIRDFLVPLLVSLKRYKEASSLLSQHEDDDAVWIVYSRALLHYRQRGDTKTARKALVHAIECNHHVVEYLLNPDFEAARALPDFYSPGGQDEAYLYVKEWRKDWRNAKGSLAWIVSTLVDGFVLKPR
jgi:tetratricopeptide (TPR) repeat protein